MARIDINNAPHFEHIDANFEAIAEYARAVERFLEHEFLEHRELRPIEPIKISAEGCPSWMDEDDRSQWEDDENQRLAEDFNKEHLHLTYYFPNLQRTTALTATVTFYEFWIRRVSLAVQGCVVRQGKWSGRQFDSGARLDEIRKLLKKNEFLKEKAKSLLNPDEEEMSRINDVIYIRNFFSHQNGNSADPNAINANQRGALGHAVKMRHISKRENSYLIEQIYALYFVELLHKGAIRYLCHALDFDKNIQIDY